MTQEGGHLGGRGPLTAHTAFVGSIAEATRVTQIRVVGFVTCGGPLPAALTTLLSLLFGQLLLLFHQSYTQSSNRPRNAQVATPPEEVSVY
jgi:hypothetical protein